MEIILMTFLKETLIGAIWSFRNKNGMASSYLWISSEVFLLILRNKRIQEVPENFISCLFFEKKSQLGQFDLFRSFFNVWLGVVKLCQATVTIGSLKSQDMINMLKQSGHDFPGKHLCSGYCT